MGATVGSGDTVAFVLIKAELGKAAEVAAAVSTYNEKFDTDKGVAVRGVRWAAIVTGTYDVIAAVRVDSNEALGDLVLEQIQSTPGIRNPSTVVVAKWFVDGQGVGFGENGYP